MNEFQIAEDASRRLKMRLSGSLGTRASGEVEESMKQEIMGSFDFASAHNVMLDAQRKARMESKEISDLLFDLNKTSGTTLVLVTHDLELAKTTDRLLKIDHGRLQEVDA